MDIPAPEDSRFNHEIVEGYCKFQLRDYCGAHEHFLAAAALNQQNPYAILACGVLECMLDRRQDAIAHYNEACNLLGSLSRANSAHIKTSESVYRGILCKRTAFYLRLLSQALVATCKITPGRHEVVVQHVVTENQLESALPPSYISQIEKLLVQVFHASVNYTAMLSMSTDGDEVAVTLKLMAAKFGVEGFLGGDNDVHNKGVNLRGFVVHMFEIDVSPSVGWNPDCTLSTVRPGDEHNTYPVQFSEGGGYQAAVNVSPVAVPTATFQVNNAQAVTTNSPTHGWSKSSPSTSPNHRKGWKSEWKLHMYKTGKKFSTERCSGRSIPELPFEDPANINYPSMEGHEATWTIPFDVAERLNFEFAFKGTIQAKNILVYRRRLRDFVRIGAKKPLPFSTTVSFPFDIHCKFLRSVEREIFKIN